MNCSDRNSGQYHLREVSGMLSKLVKYDIKSLIRVFIPVWIVAPVIAVMLSATIHLLSVADGPLMNVFSEYIGPILLGILAVLFVAVIVGMMIMTLILVIRRFWNGLLKEEGYLAFTLPVEVWQLIVSKVIVAAIVNLISGLIAALSCLILFLGISKEIFYSMGYTFSVIWRSMTGELGAYTGVLIVLGILFLIVTSICGIYMLYASMSLGQLMEDHRVAGSFLAYIGLNMAVSTITNIGTMIVTNILPDNLVNITAGNAGLIITLYMLIMLVINGTQLAVYHMITEYVLTNKLNLE